MFYGLTGTLKNSEYHKYSVILTKSSIPSAVLLVKFSNNKFKFAFRITHHSIAKPEKLFAKKDGGAKRRVGGVGDGV